ncbi:MAG: hypothetical protein ABEI75_00545 [Halobaculum sp.]
MQPEQVYRAARRYVELAEFRGRFHSTLQDGIEQIRTFESEFARRRVTDADELQSRLTGCEYAVHDVVNYVFMLNEMSDAVTTRFSSVELVDVAPPNQSVPELLGLRNAVCHNGLLGMNVAANDNGARVYLPLENVERYARWDEARTSAAFDRWFGEVDGNVLVVTRALSEGEGAVDAVVDALRTQLRSEYGGSRFRRFTAAHPIYQRY